MNDHNLLGWWILLVACGGFAASCAWMGVLMWRAIVWFARRRHISRLLDEIAREMRA
jgi:hypothetical protein